MKKLEGYDADQILNIEYFDNLLKEAVAEERNVALYCGEYGVINLATERDTLKWYQMICSVLDKYRIGKAAWTYKGMDFGLVDKHMEGILQDILKII